MMTFIVFIEIYFLLGGWQNFNRRALIPVTHQKMMSLNNICMCHDYVGYLRSATLKRMKDLEEENRRLKQMFADLSLENRALKDVIEKKL